MTHTIGVLLLWLYSSTEYEYVINKQIVNIMLTIIWYVFQQIFLLVFLITDTSMLSLGNGLWPEPMFT